MSTIDRIANINSLTRGFGFETEPFQPVRLDDMEIMGATEERSTCLEVGCFNLRELGLEDKWGWGNIVNYGEPCSVNMLTDRQIAELFRRIVEAKQNIVLRDQQGRVLDREQTYSADRIQIKVDDDGNISPGGLFFVSGHADVEKDPICNADWASLPER